MIALKWFLFAVLFLVEERDAWTVSRAFATLGA
jgi:hypothetical protein